MKIQDAFGSIQKALLFIKVIYHKNIFIYLHFILTKLYIDDNMKA